MRSRRKAAWSRASQQGKTRKDLKDANHVEENKKKGLMFLRKTIEGLEAWQ
jgi:hypothetical protein